MKRCAHGRISVVFALTMIALCTLWPALGCAGKLDRTPRGFRHQPQAGLIVIGADLSLSAEATVETDDPIHFAVKSNESAGRDERGRERYADFRGYVQPQGSPKGNAGHRVTFSNPIIEIGSGWGYFIGLYPAARTGRVGAVGVGTEIVLEIDIDTNADGAETEVHRVYCISASKGVHVFVPWDAGEAVHVLDPGEYLESVAVNQASEPANYGDNPERKAFIKKVLSKVHKAGVK
jgi:hypothetical protein